VRVAAANRFDLSPVYSCVRCPRLWGPCVVHTHHRQRRRAPSSSRDRPEEPERLAQDGRVGHRTRLAASAPISTGAGLPVGSLRATMLIVAWVVSVSGSTTFTSRRSLLALVRRWARFAGGPGTSWPFDARPTRYRGSDR